MSPSYTGGSGNWTRVFYVNYSGSLSEYTIADWRVIRPVITLKPEVKVSGSGTTDDPFIPSL